LCALVAIVWIAPAPAGAKRAGAIVVGVSWSHFQEERWKIDEASLVAALRERGARYLSADAQSSSEK
jgi:D-xylose transport system substrate-binding protein